ncbi:MAG: DUF2017 family protein [Actinomycetota bacterium]
MVFGRRNRLFKPAGDGFRVDLAPEAREWVLELAEQLSTVLEVDDPALRRLYPTAYPDDPDKEAGYQILARQQLSDGRREAIELMRASAQRDNWTEDELGAWLGITNDLRLVLGTRLDVSEDDHEIDEADPDADAMILYHQLGYLVGEIVDALTLTLPPPTRED